MNSFTTAIISNRKKMVLCTTLTVLWTAGLLAVLESDSLVSQISILLLLGPVSVAVDSIINTILQNQRSVRIYSNQELEKALKTSENEIGSLLSASTRKLSTLTFPRYVGN